MANFQLASWVWFQGPDFRTIHRLLWQAVAAEAGPQQADVTLDTVRRLK